MVYLDTVYFAKIENLLLKVLQIKVKISWNSTMRLMNSTKNTIKIINNNKNKLNNKII